MEVFYLHSQGLPGEQIQRLCVISTGPLITILRSTARAGWHNAKRSPSRRDSMHGTSIAGCLEASLARAPARNRRRSPSEGRRPDRHHAPTDAGAAVSAHARAEARHRGDGPGHSGGRGPSRRARGLLYGCRALCVWSIAGNALVCPAAVCEDARQAVNACTSCPL